MASVFDTLEERGYVEQLTHPEEIKKLFEKESVPFYIGIDPTADSLHVGHFISLMVAAHMQKAGHKPIILMGGGTAVIGDPSGKSDMRKMLTIEDIDSNVEHIKKQVEKFLRFDGENPAIIVNNGDWLRDLKYLDFLRTIGVHFNVNKMLAAECYKARLESGLTFFELGYMLMQSYDFLVLNRKYGCVLQCGGDDQWSNMLAGADLIRRKEQKAAFAITFALLTTSEGKKMGKTAKGAVWLDAEKTSPYDFFQYWRNIEDADVIKCFKLLTFLSLDRINEIASWDDSRINEKKEILAYELTKLVHGEEEANKVLAAARSLFSGEGNDENMPSCELELSEYTITDLLVASQLCASKSEARRLIEQGGVSVDGEKITNPNEMIDITSPRKIKKGKKIFLKVNKK